MGQARKVFSEEGRARTGLCAEAGRLEAGEAGDQNRHMGSMISKAENLKREPGLELTRVHH